MGLIVPEGFFLGVNLGMAHVALAVNLRTYTSGRTLSSIHCVGRFKFHIFVHLLIRAALVSLIGIT